MVKMAKHRRYSRPRRYYKAAKHRAAKMTIPVAPMIGLVSGLADPFDSAMRGDYKNMFVKLSRNYTGYDPNTGQWSWTFLKQGAMPLLAGLAVHKAAGILGINRVLAKAKIPFVRV